ncbi:VCBS repeat-containing protein [Flagellimonas beolgyonensis]|uniref:VCBS repeat-containing protein n=1 Tax=Flagellimonas beolgyonensis TaxID=864064 RepID=UPI003D64CFEA
MVRIESLLAKKNTYSRNTIEFTAKSFNIGLLSVFFLVLLVGCKRDSKNETSVANDKITTPVFEKIDSENSRLHFSNTLKEDVSNLNNLFDYDYFYNGAGVGVEDLNNDGLLDVFFCGNQVDNKLYLNKGNMVFEDVSEKAGINVGKIWSNGITFVDINNDGWMDIYVSQGGPNQRLRRKNLLFINQKDGTFSEKAAEYGLDDMGISTQSAFFDFDNDGDLDCIVMNENERYGVDPINLYKIVGSTEEDQYFNSSHLYENIDGHYEDVTQKSGVQRPIFGLGLSVSDINNDGWLDFYIASDYYIPDALFINNGNGTFTDKIKDYTNQISYYGMGMDIADINNDNLQDIFVLDMASNDHVRSKTLMASMNTQRFDFLVNEAGYHYQYMYNSLQLNEGNNKFSNISQATGMASTDWSWSVLMADFDHDQDKDVYVTNGYRRYALDNDLQNKVFAERQRYKGRVPLDIKKRLYEEMPSEKLPNILFENSGHLNFKDNASDWGLADLSFSNGAAVGDLDNDGDLDIVVNNIDEECFLYQNNTMDNSNGNYLRVATKGLLSESYPKITIYYGDKQQFIENKRVRGYRSSHENVAHFGLSEIKKIDSIAVDWPSGKQEKKYEITSNSKITFYEKDASMVPDRQNDVVNPMFKLVAPEKIGLDIAHRENTYDDFEKEILLPYKQSTLGPSIAKGDINNDGLEDLYIGGASGQAGKILVQSNHGRFTEKKSADIANDNGYEDMDALFFDFDNDNDQDLFVVSGGNEFAEASSYYTDRLYLNDGKGNFTKHESQALEINRSSGKSVIALDIDNDGDKDLIVGNRIVPQNYPVPASSVIYENRNGKLFEATEYWAPELASFGMVNDLLATDFDNDGQMDFIAVGEWTGIGLFQNMGGSFKNIATPEISKNGWWFSVNETDVNNDGLPDYVIGNVGLNIKFKASQEKPFKVFANDFDENGTPDIVLSKKYHGEYVPVRGRECSSQQMPFIQQKFESYEKFANASLVDVYGEKLSTAYEGEVTEFKSILLINKGNGGFTMNELPIEAQLFPVLKVVSKDLNADGYEDLILAGNIYETEVETPRLDAISGLVLLSNQKDGYKPQSFKKSGLYLDGNVKDIELLHTKENEYILATRNNAKTMVYKLNP